MIGGISSGHLWKHILVLVLCSLSLYSEVNTTSCGGEKNTDANRCDKIIPGGRRCYLFTHLVLGCENGQMLCKVNRTLCLPYQSVCTQQCCDGWKEDKEHRCTVNIYSLPMPDSEVDRTSVPTVISVTVVGLLFIVLAVMSFAMFRVCKARRNLRGRLRRNIRGSATNMQNYNSSIYTVYNNEPPPYDVIENSKLPEYTPQDSPPSYEDNNQATGCSEISVSISEQSNADNDPNINRHIYTLDHLPEIAPNDPKSSSE